MVLEPGEYAGGLTYLFKKKKKKRASNISRNFVCIHASSSRIRSQRNGSSEFPHVTKPAVCV